MYCGIILRVNQHHPPYFSYHQINRFRIYLASISSDVIVATMLHYQVAFPQASPGAADDG